MARNNGRTVYLRSDGRWANKANDALKASDYHDSRADACASAVQMLTDSGGGELTIKEATGEIERRSISAGA